jgi:hypothetical protein
MVPPTDLHPGRPQREKMQATVFLPDKAGTVSPARPSGSYMVDPAHLDGEIAELKALHPNSRIRTSPPAAWMEANIPKGAT